MPRLKNALPKLRKHASGQAIVTICGHDHYLGHWGSAKTPTKAVQQKYDAKIAEWLAVGRPTVSRPESRNSTVADLLLAFLRYADKTYGQRDRHSRYYVFKRVAKRLKPYSDLRVSEFGPSQLKGVRETLIASGMTRVSVNQEIGVVRQIFKWGVADELVPVEVLQRLACVSGLRRGYSEAKEGEAVLPVDEEAVEATIPHLPPLVRNMVRLQQIVGCRPAELCNLRIGDINTTSLPWTAHLAEHKTAHHGKKRTLCFGPRARAILSTIIDGRANTEFVFDPRLSESIRHDGKRVTPLNQGDRIGYSAFTRTGKRKRKRAPTGSYTSASYRRAVTRACGKAFPVPKGLNAAAEKQWRIDHRWSPNQIRHAVATQIRKSADLETAGLVLGHSNLATTQIYAERDFTKLQQLMEQVG